MSLAGSPKRQKKSGKPFKPAAVALLMIDFILDYCRAFDGVIDDCVVVPVVPSAALRFIACEIFKIGKIALDVIGRDKITF